MANLSKSKILFGFTSPRTINKIVPEIKILSSNFCGEKWLGNQGVQEALSKKVKFSIKPYLELLRLIRDLGSLSKTEIALFFTQLIHYSKYNTIVKKIINFRKGSKLFNGSRKMYVNQCFENEILKIYSEEVEIKNLKTRESNDVSLKKFIKTKKANMIDYADAFVRNIRATELVTFQKQTFRLIISPQKVDEVEFLLKNIDRKPKEFKSIKEFKDYLFDPYAIKLLSDNKTFLVEKIRKLGFEDFDKNTNIESLKDTLEKLQHQVKSRNIEEKKKELKDYKEFEKIVETFNQIKSKDVLDAPLFLEWNVWRSFVVLNYAKRIDGNFIMDIDGMPLNTALGNKPDLEIEFDDFGIIGEVTLSTGATQFKMEGDSVPRHYGDFKKRVNKESYCLFIAPKIDEGTKAFFFNLNKGYTKRYGGATKIIPLTLDKFVEFIKVGVDSKFSKPKKLKEWLEMQWKINQKATDELEWSLAIDKNIQSWAI